MSFSERTTITISIFGKTREQFGNVSNGNTTAVYEDDSNPFSHTLLIASCVLALLVLLAAIGNGLLCYVVLHSINHRHHSDLFIASLAVADFLMCTMVFPFTVINLIFKNWKFVKLFCKIWTFLDTALCAVSIYTMMAICMNICYHAKLSFVSLRKLLTDYSKLYTGGIWLWGFAIATMVVISSAVKVKDRNEYSAQNVDKDLLLCFFEEPLSVAIADVSVTFLLPLLYCVYLYTKVLIRLKAYNLATDHWTRRRMCPDPGSRRIPLTGLFTVTNRYTEVLVLGIKLLVFFVAWAPFFTAKIVTVACHSCVNKVSHSMVVFLPYVSSWLSPLVYGMLNPRVRSHLQQLWWCFSKTTRTARQVSMRVHRDNRESLDTYRFKNRYTSLAQPFPSEPHATPVNSQDCYPCGSSNCPSLQHLATALQYSEVVSDFPRTGAVECNVHLHDSCHDSRQTENYLVSDGVDYIFVACDDICNDVRRVTDQTVAYATEVVSEGFDTTILSKDGAATVSSVNTDSDEHVCPTSNMEKGRRMHAIDSYGDTHGKVISNKVTGSIHFAPLGDHLGVRKNGANQASHSASEAANQAHVSVTDNASCGGLTAGETTNRIRPFATEPDRIPFSTSDGPDYANASTSEGVDHLGLTASADEDNVSRMTSSEGADLTVTTSECVDHASLAVSRATEDLGLATDADSLATSDWAEHVSSLSSEDADHVSLGVSEFTDHISPVSSENADYFNLASSERDVHSSLAKGVVERIVRNNLAGIDQEAGNISLSTSEGDDFFCPIRSEDVDHANQSMSDDRDHTCRTSADKVNHSDFADTVHRHYILKREAAHCNKSSPPFRSSLQQGQVGGTSQQTLNEGMERNLVNTMPATPFKGVSKPIPARRSTLTKTRVQNTSPDVNRTLPSDMNLQPQPRTIDGLLTGMNRAIRDFSDGTQVSMRTTASTRVRRRTLLTPRARILSKYLKSKYKAKITLKHHRTYSRFQREKTEKILEERPSTSFQLCVPRSGPSSDGNAHLMNTVLSTAPRYQNCLQQTEPQPVPARAEPQGVQNSNESQAAQIYTESQYTPEHTELFEFLTNKTPQVVSAEHHKLMCIQPPAETTFSTVSPDAFFDASDSRPEANLRASEVHDDGNLHISSADSHGEPSKVLVQSGAADCMAGSSVTVDPDPRGCCKPSFRSDSCESFISARTHTSVRSSNTYSRPASKQPQVCDQEGSSDDDIIYFVPRESTPADSLSCSSAGTSIYVEVGSQKGFHEQFHSDNEAQCRENIQLVAGSGDISQPVVTQDYNISSKPSAIGLSGSFQDTRMGEQMGCGQDNSSVCSLSTESSSEEKLIVHTYAKSRYVPSSVLANIRIASCNEISKSARNLQASKPGCSEPSFGNIASTVKNSRSHQDIPRARLALNSQGDRSVTSNTSAIRQCNSFSHKQSLQTKHLRRVSSTEVAQNRQPFKNTYSTGIHTEAVQGSLVSRCKQGHRSQLSQRRHHKSESPDTFLRLKSDTRCIEKLSQTELDRKNADLTRKMKEGLSGTETLKKLAVPSAGAGTSAYTSADKTAVGDLVGSKDNKTETQKILTPKAVGLSKSTMLSTQVDKVKKKRGLSKRHTEDDGSDHNQSTSTPKVVIQSSPTAPSTQLSGKLCKAERDNDPYSRGQNTQGTSLRLENLRRSEYKHFQPTVRSQGQRTRDPDHSDGQDAFNRQNIKLKLSAKSDNPINIDKTEHTEPSRSERLNKYVSKTTIPYNLERNVHLAVPSGIISRITPIRTPRKLDEENDVKRHESRNTGVKLVWPIEPFTQKIPSKSENPFCAGNPRSLVGSESKPASPGLQTEHHGSTICSVDNSSEEQQPQGAVESTDIVPRRFVQSTGKINQEQIRPYYMYLQTDRSKTSVSRKADDSASFHAQGELCNVWANNNSTVEITKSSEKMAKGADEKPKIKHATQTYGTTTPKKTRLGVNSLRNYTNEMYSSKLKPNIQSTTIPRGHVSSMATGTSVTLKDQAEKDAGRLEGVPSTSEHGGDRADAVSTKPAGTECTPASKKSYSEEMQKPKCIGIPVLFPRRPKQSEPVDHLLPNDRDQTSPLSRKCRFRLSQQRVHDLTLTLDGLPETTRNGGHATESRDKETVAQAPSLDAGNKETNIRKPSPKSDSKSSAAAAPAPDTSRGTSPRNPISPLERRKSQIAQALISEGRRTFPSLMSESTVRRLALSRLAAEETGSWRSRHIPMRRGGTPSRAAIGLFASYCKEKEKSDN